MCLFIGFVLGFATDAILQRLLDHFYPEKQELSDECEGKCDND